MSRVLVVGAVVLCACSNLPDRSETCGNGVIDRGESCDSTSPSCKQCQLQCPAHTDQECGAAGAAYRCGADDVCHAPSGVFHTTADYNFVYAVGRGQIADLDGDRIGDVAGFSDVNIDARFGDPAGRLSTRATAIVPFANTNLSLRALPGDPMHGVPDISDIVLPTDDGIADFTARNKTVVSYPFANNPGESGTCATAGGVAEPRESFSIDKHHVAFISRYRDDQPNRGQLVLEVMDPSLPTNCKRIDLCGMTMPGGAARGRLAFDHYETPLPQPNDIVSSLIAVMSPGDTPNAPNGKACVIRFDDASGVFSFNTTQPLSLIVGNSPIAFARGSASSLCPGFYAQHPSPAMPTEGIDYYAPDATAGCYFKPVVASTHFAQGQFPVGRIPLGAQPKSPQPVYPLDLLAVLSPFGMTGSTSFHSLLAGVPVPTPVFTSPRPLYPIRYADIDGDGTIEGIGEVGPVVGAQPDFEILYRTQQGPGFIAYRLPTQYAPAYVDLGDFDGNGLPDIAYTEKLSPKEERLMIAYSTHDRPHDPIEIATFNSVATMSRIDIPDSLDPTGNVLDDLFIVDLVSISKTDPSAFQPLIDVLHGNPQRSMLAYYDPRGLSNGFAKSSFVAVVAGNFDATNFYPKDPDRPDDPRVPIHDVIAFEQAKPSPTDMPSGPAMRIWTLPGSPYTRGFVDPMPPISTTSVASVTCPTGATLCLSGASLVPWDLPDGRSIVLGVDPGPAAAGDQRQRTIVTIDPKSATPVFANTNVTLPPFRPATSPWQGVIDATGVSRLVVSLPTVAAFHTPGPDQVYICDVDSDGKIMGCNEISTLVPDLAGFNCGAAQTGRIGGASRFVDHGAKPPQGFLALCSAGTDSAIFHVHPDKTGALIATRVISGVPDYEFLAVGDINGDFVDDVAGISFDQMTQTPVISVHLQCDAANLDCIDANADKLTVGPQ